MPTPYGSRGGMAFSAAELHVLRRSLAHALHPASEDPLGTPEVRDCLRLAQALDEADREAARLRAFLLADLGRYRAALPGSLTGYLELLQDALATGYRPEPDDLAALRALRGNATAAALLERCRVLAERSLLSRPAPGPRTRLLALPGGRETGPAAAPAAPAATGTPEGAGGAPTTGGGPAPVDAADTPEPGRPAGPVPPAPSRPSRPVPTPGEVFPPRRKPAPPPSGRAAG
ncbi:hypothetical protein [Streptomyces sp. NPDC097619]|uniref:hypothetical protein n=1 Tax=Streptomyces sp. NPDC097619 TaxID=3157228 RepID=UPI00332D0058